MAERTVRHCDIYKDRNDYSGEINKVQVTVTFIDDKNEPISTLHNLAYDMSPKASDRLMTFVKRGTSPPPPKKKKADKPTA